MTASRRFTPHTGSLLMPALPTSLADMKSLNPLPTPAYHEVDPVVTPYPLLTTASNASTHVGYDLYILHYKAEGENVPIHWCFFLPIRGTFKKGRRLGLETREVSIGEELELERERKAELRRAEGHPSSLGDDCLFSSTNRGGGLRTPSPASLQMNRNPSVFVSDVNAYSPTSDPAYKGSKFLGSLTPAQLATFQRVMEEMDVPVTVRDGEVGRGKKVQAFMVDVCLRLEEEGVLDDGTVGVLEELPC
ncbi:hypothetical protein BT69DRAFT_1284847 [Atractiella rhizophila]|nr:hypothetical protein BT69DRAFT_1284847 [Atractiella rhizophila]